MSYLLVFIYCYCFYLFIWPVFNQECPLYLISGGGKVQMEQ